MDVSKSCPSQLGTDYVRGKRKENIHSRANGTEVLAYVLVNVVLQLCFSIKVILKMK